MHSFESSSVLFNDFVWAVKKQSKAKEPMPTQNGRIQQTGFIDNISRILSTDKNDEVWSKNNITKLRRLRYRVISRSLFLSSYIAEA